MPSSLRQVNETVAEWFHDHVAIWWLILACVPGGAYAGAQLLIGGGSPTHAAVLGAVFGAIFATITVGVQTWRSE